ncbi:ketosynthase chain-length factor [Salinifilum ghardaiensis]
MTTTESALDSRRQPGDLGSADRSGATGCRRTLVTGIGVIAPTGVGSEAHWKSLMEARSAVGPLTRFEVGDYPVRLAGEVRGFDADEHVPPRLHPQTDHMTRMSLAAAQWSLADAGIDPQGMAEYEMSVCTASSAGGFEFGQRELQKLWGSGPHHVSAYQSFAWFYAVNSGQISIRHGMRGPSGVLVADQAGSLDSLAMARRRLYLHGSRIAVAGAVDSTLCPWGWTAHLARGGMSNTADPAAAYLPFDQGANGHVVGEGGAILVLEHPENRHGDAEPYCMIAGHAATFDAVPDGNGLRRAALLALEDADVAADEVDVVFADAAGDRARDAVEAHTLRELFGARGVAVTAPKTMTGRLMSGGAALDVATAALALRHEIIPPTVFVHRPDPGHSLDLVRDQPRRCKLSVALVLARGEDGFCSAVVLTAPSPRPSPYPEPAPPVA